MRLQATKQSLSPSFSPPLVPFTPPSLPRFLRCSHSSLSFLLIGINHHSSHTHKRANSFFRNTHNIHVPVILVHQLNTHTHYSTVTIVHTHAVQSLFWHLLVCTTKKGLYNINRSCSMFTVSQCQKVAHYCYFVKISRYFWNNFYFFKSVFLFF